MVEKKYKNENIGWEYGKGKKCAKKMCKSQILSPYDVVGTIIS
jgi:hypothetical protein